jgi:hypothetical protein
VKPITDVEEFVKRFDNFKDGEIRSMKIISPTTMLVTLAGQDSARAFDWITIDLEFSGVSDARLLEDSKLSLIDMNDGISIINENNKFAFGIGECNNISGIKNATAYIESDNLKYEEGSF